MFIGINRIKIKSAHNSIPIFTDTVQSGLEFTFQTHILKQDFSVRRVAVQLGDDMEQQTIPAKK